jgi:asparagine synthase (glutamine-hydrolysing)
MCGIAGIYSRQKKTKIEKSIMQKMIAVQYHRGPDESGFLFDKNFAMAMARLSIIDLQSGGQPIHNEDKSVWVVFNGEIFNYIELREILQKQGHRFYTSSDTEVIVHLYEKYGLDFVRHLNGQFAIAIWDTKQRKLILARDRVGIRPLFYTRQGSDLYFASEMKSFFATGEIQPELNTEGLADIFTFWVNLSPQSSFKNIFELPAGHLMEVSEKNIKIQQYWHPEFPAKKFFMQSSHEQLIEETQALIHDAVKLRLRSDVPVAAYLSGGLDSSIISSLVKKYHNNELITFSVAFKDVEYDERKYQEQMAKHIGTRHHVIEVDDKDIAKKFIDTIWYAEKPMMRTAPAPLLALSSLVRSNNIKVVLTGEGADEMFGGYNIFKENLVRRFWAREPQSAVRPLLLARLYPYILKNQQAVNPFWQAFFKRHLMETDNPYYSHLLRWENTAKIKSIFASHIRSQFDLQKQQLKLETYMSKKLGGWHPLNQAQYLEIVLFMSGYLLSSQGDRMMMGNSVEGRFPFLDHRVIEYAAKLSPEIKINGLNEKFILKESFKHLLPADIAKRPKQPYRAPIASVFLADDTPDLIKEMLDENTIKNYGYFENKAISGLVKKLKRSSANTSARDDMALVAAVSTQLLHYHFIENFSQHRFKLPEKQNIVDLN